MSNPLPGALADARAASPRQAVQARAHETRQALLDAGRRLLAERDLAAVSIAELASAIGMSVGSFYGRFADKEAFFAELQAEVIGEWRSGFPAALAALQPLSPQAMVQGACALAIGLLRRDAGFLRAALKHESTHPGTWSPVKQVGVDIVNQLVPLLAPRLTALPRSQREQQVWVAMQVVFSTGVNAVLHDPGPLHLSNEQLEVELARMMCAYLKLPMPRRRLAKARQDFHHQAGTGQAT